MGTQGVLDWLLSPENPPVRYLTARDLQRPRPSDRALRSLRKAVLDWEPLRQVLALQREDGGFRSLEKAPTAIPTFAAVGLMERCGMDAGDPPVARALAYLAAHHAARGAFSYLTGGSGILPCYVGLVTRPLVRMGACDHPAVRASIAWMIDHQRFDHKQTRAGGGEPWPYRAPFSYGCWSSVSCYHGVAAVFRALAAIPPRKRSAELKARLGEAIEYLRIHRVFKKSAQDKPLFRHMTQFFLVGSHRCHLIDVLEGIAEADRRLIGQAWVREAVDAVDGCGVDGRIVLAKNYSAKLLDPLPFEPVGRPSRFLTCRWLGVKQKFGLC